MKDALTFWITIVIIAVALYFAFSHDMGRPSCNSLESTYMPSYTPFGVYEK